MKLIIRFLIGVLLLVVAGCSHLDFDESSGESKEYYYAYFGQLNGLVRYGYVNMENLSNIGGGMLACGTDDAEYTYSNSSVQAFNDGSWSPHKTIDSRWSLSYQAIYAMNDYLETLDVSKLERHQYNKDYAQNMENLRYWTLEARILRAYHLFELAKRYGDIPMPLKTLDAAEANSIEKTPFDDVISFIVSECEFTADSLPVRWDVEGLNEETGRFTRGAAMALKSRALLYAASPLHNTGNSTQKWEDAAQAAHDIIDSAFYSLEPISKNIFNTIEANSSELILTNRNMPSNSFESRNFPIGYEGGHSGTTPTQNLVDAFQTINGYDVTLSASGWVCDDPAFDPAQPYANRDPRFYNTVLYDNAPFKGRPIEVYENGLDASPIAGATLTGYYLKKYVVESVNLSPTVNSTAYHHWILYRYAETLLNYAEAMNEAYGPNDPGSFTLSALDALNQVRTRANMPL